MCIRDRPTTYQSGTTQGVVPLRLANPANVATSALANDPGVISFLQRATYPMARSRPVLAGATGPRRHLDKQTQQVLRLKASQSRNLNSPDRLWHWHVMRHRNRADPGGDRRGDARGRVLDRDTGCQVGPEQTGGHPVWLRVRLAMADNITGDDRGEAAFRQVTDHSRRQRPPRHRDQCTRNPLRNKARQQLAGPRAPGHMFGDPGDDPCQQLVDYLDRG